MVWPITKNALPPVASSYGSRFGQSMNGYVTLASHHSRLVGNPYLIGKVRFARYPRVTVTRVLPNRLLNTDLSGQRDKLLAEGARLCRSHQLPSPFHPDSYNVPSRSGHGPTSSTHSQN